MSLDAVAAYYAVGVIVGIVSIWGIVRVWRISLLRERANERIAPNTSESKVLAENIARLTNDKVTAAELGAYSAVTVAEFAWNWAIIDPHIIQAADFSSTACIDNGFQFAQYLHTHFESLSIAAKEGFLNRLMGYVGEQHVADILIHQGHTVEIAATANQAVWDLLIDGHAANVKTVAHIASIKAEAAAHPSILYIIPEDTHGHAVNNILDVAGFKHEVAKESIKTSLLAAKGETALHGLFHHLPWITIGFAAYRNIKAIEKGKDPATALNHGIAESVGRGVGVLTGAKGGALVGTLFGPVGTLIGGVLGGFGGALLGGAAAESFKQRHLHEALAQMERDLNAFGSSFKLQIDSIRDYLHSPLTRMRRNITELEEQIQRRKSTLRWIIWPDFYTILLDEAAKRGVQQIAAEQANVAQVNQVLNEAEQTGRYTKVGLLMANSPVVRELVGFDVKLLKSVEQARQKMFYERKQLNPDFEVPE